MQVGVDDQIIVFGVGLSFAARFEKAILYFRFLLGAAAAKPLLEFRKARRKNEDGDGVVGINGANLACALDIDIEQDVAAGCDRGIQRPESKVILSGSAAVVKFSPPCLECGSNNQTRLRFSDYARLWNFWEHSQPKPANNRRKAKSIKVAFPLT